MFSSSQFPRGLASRPENDTNTLNDDYQCHYDNESSCFRYQIIELLAEQATSVRSPSAKAI